MPVSSCRSSRTIKPVQQGQFIFVPEEDGDDMLCFLDRLVSQITFRDMKDGRVRSCCGKTSNIQGNMRTFLLPGKDKANDQFSCVQNTVRRHTHYRVFGARMHWPENLHGIMATSL